MTTTPMSDPALLDPDQPGPVWKSHKDYEDKNPRAKDIRLETGRGTDPCPGDLRFDSYELLDRKPHPMLRVECDICGTRFGVARSAWDPNAALDARLERAGLPAMYRGKRMGAHPGQAAARDLMRDWLGGWESSESKLASGLPMVMPAPGLWGAPGRGKSHLLCSTMEYLMRKHNVEVRYWTMSGLLAAMRRSYVTGDDAEWQSALTCHVLALDDIGAERPTEYALDTMATLVDTRYTEERPILVASNIDPAQWPQEFGARTASRLRGMVIPIKVEGPDWRQADAMANVVPLYPQPSA